MSAAAADVYKRQLQNGDMYYETAQEGGGMSLFAGQSADALTNDDTFAKEQPALVPVGQ